MLIPNTFEALFTYLFTRQIIQLARHARRPLPLYSISHGMVHFSKVYPINYRQRPNRIAAMRYLIISELKTRVLSVELSKRNNVVAESAALGHAHEVQIIL